MNFKDVAIVRRDVEVTLIPYGQSITLMPGQEVLVTQALGGSYTLNVNGNLVRLEGKDADAIGKEVIKMPVDDSNIKSGDPIDEDLVWAQLKTVYDPEIPVNIVDLGLIYDLRVDDLDNGKKDVSIKMTLTAQGCGMGPVIAQDAKSRVEQIEEIENAEVKIVWDPVWNPQMISAAGRQVLGLE